MFRGEEEDGTERRLHRSSSSSPGKRKNLRRPKSSVQLRREESNLKHRRRNRWAPKVAHYETLDRDGKKILTYLGRYYLSF